MCAVRLGARLPCALQVSVAAACRRRGHLCLPFKPAAVAVAVRAPFGLLFHSWLRHIVCWSCFCLRTYLIEQDTAAAAHIPRRACLPPCCSYVFAQGATLAGFEVQCRQRRSACLTDFEHVWCVSDCVSSAVADHETAAAGHADAMWQQHGLLSAAALIRTAVLSELSC